jgi:predicted transcriptional regulator
MMETQSDPNKVEKLIFTARTCIYRLKSDDQEVLSILVAHHNCTMGEAFNALAASKILGPLPLENVR